MSNPRGYITRLLVIDCETSGLHYNMDAACYNPVTKEYYQAVSWGLIVVDAQTFKTIDELYVEIKWDGKSLWNAKAEAIHGMSKKYLAENGISRTEAVEEIANLLLKHWGPDMPICVAGHNPSFDLAFLKQDLRSEGLELRFGSKMVDTNTIGLVVYGTHNSDDLFKLVGVNRTTHSALEDAKACLQVLRITKQLSEKCFG